MSKAFSLPFGFCEQCSAVTMGNSFWLVSSLLLMLYLCKSCFTKGAGYAACVLSLCCPALALLFLSNKAKRQGRDATLRSDEYMNSSLTGDRSSLQALITGSYQACNQSNVMLAQMAMRVLLGLPCCCGRTHQLAKPSVPPCAMQRQQSKWQSS